jgi:hypothetical protein
VREFAKQIIIKKKKHKRKEKGNIFSILQSGPIKRYVFDHLGRLIFNFDFFSLKKKKIQLMFGFSSPWNCATESCLCVPITSYGTPSVS